MNRTLVRSLAVSLIVATGLTLTAEVLDAWFRAEGGLTRTLHEGTTFADPPLLSETVGDVDLDFLEAQPELPRRLFSVLWRGVWYLGSDQAVDIYAGGDDRVEVWIDGEVVLERGREEGMHTVSRPLDLQAGFHDLTIRYVQNRGGYRLNVQWAPAGAVARPFDPDALFPSRLDPGEVRTNRRLATLHRVVRGVWFVPPVMLLFVIGLAFLTRSLRLLLGGVSVAAHWVRRRFALVSALIIVVVLVGSLTAGFLRSTPHTYPVGDGAALEIFALQASRGELRVGSYSRFGWNQPGPAFFYLLAPLYVLSGQREYSLNWTVLIVNLLCVAAIVSVAGRYGGPSLGLVAVAVLSLCFFRAGPQPDFSDLLWSTWNPHVPMFPLALLLLLAAVLASGFVVALPIVVVLASFVVQTHLGLAPCAAAVAAVSLLIFVAGRVRERVAGIADERVTPLWWVALDVGTVAYIGLLVWSLVLSELWVSSGSVAQPMLVAGAWVLAACYTLPPSAPLDGRVWGWREVAGMFHARNRGAGRVGGLTIGFWIGTSVWLSVLLWCLPVADEVVRTGGKNFTALARFFMGESEFEQPSRTLMVAAFTRALSLAPRANEPVALGSRVWSDDPSLTALVWSGAQLVTLPLAAWWAYSRGKTFHAVLCLVCLVGTLAAAWSVSQVRGPLFDHLVYWISILGVMNTVAIVGVAVSWMADLFRSERRRVPAIATPMVYVAFVAVVAVHGVTNLVQDHQLTLHGQDRFAPERQAAMALYDVTQDHLRSEIRRRPVLRIDQPAWSLAAGTALQLLKAGTPLTVEDRWLFMYSEALRSTGSEDVELQFVSREPSAETPGAQLLATRSGVFLYALDR